MFKVINPEICQSFSRPIEFVYVSISKIWKTTLCQQVVVQEDAGLYGWTEISLSIINPTNRIFLKKKSEKQNGLFVHVFTIEDIPEVRISHLVPFKFDAYKPRDT